MFPTNPTKIVITGMHVPSGFAYRLENGKVITSESNHLIGGLTPSGKTAEPLVFGITTKTPKVFAFSVVSLAGTTHIKGTVVPVDADVKVSAYTEPCDNWDEELEANLIEDVQTDEYGEFSISFSGREEKVVFWCEVHAKLGSWNSGINLNVSHENSDGNTGGGGNGGGGGGAVDPEGGGPYLVMQRFQCPTYNGEGAYEPTFTIFGVCPEDVSQVFISVDPAIVGGSSGNLLTDLQNNILYSAIASNGNYSVDFYEPIYASDVVVWCISEINGYISMEYTVDQGSFDAICLAGDTPILLYDGTKKALRDLCADDVLMAGDRTPTRITKIERGIVSDYHTLYLFEDGTVIDEAHRHRFFNVDAGYWMYLDEWKLGDRAKKSDGSTPKLLLVERVEEPCRRYGLWTESHDYYAGGLLSGETAANQNVLADATIGQVADMMATLDAKKLDKLYKGVLG